MKIILLSALKTLLWIVFPILVLFALVMSPKAIVLALALGWLGFLLYAFITAPATKANPSD